VPDTQLDCQLAADLPATQGSALLFGAGQSQPLWLWLALEPEEVTALEGALLTHLRSPLFPSRIGDEVTAGDDASLLRFASQFAPLANRYAHGQALVLAAARVVAERGGPLCRQGALAAIEALQHVLHAGARGLGGDAEALRRFVLGARLAADLWLRFVPQPEAGFPTVARLAELREAPTPIMAEEATPVPVEEPAASVPSVRVLGAFEPPNDRGEWQSYRVLSSPLPLRQVPRDASARLAALAQIAPAFAAPLAEIRRKLALSAHAGRPSPRLRPILLVGPPGVGKTWFARRVAQALDLPFASLNLGGATDNRCLQGTARGWSAATPAWPIAEMARLHAPNPVLFLDEVEKAGGQRETNGRAHDTLLAMIEPESAGVWFDECLRTSADLRHALWIMAANETRGIPAPLLSRLSVHQVEPPPASAFEGTLAGLLAGIAADMGCLPEELPMLEPETHDALRRSFARHRNLRRLRSQVEECLGMAAEAVLARAS
jgi:ATPase family associated with various cellular activities (AAA)